MKLVFATPLYELYAERKEIKDVVSITLYSVWPKARTDRSPHKLLNINLPDHAVKALGKYIAWGE